MDSLLMTYPQQKLSALTISRIPATVVSVENVTFDILGDGFCTFDDGTNSDYSSTGYPGFPVLHGAPLDRPVSTKGGPYSHGTFAGAGQYARIDVRDDGGDTIEVRLSGHNWRDEELVALDFVFDVDL